MIKDQLQAKCRYLWDQNAVWRWRVILSDQFCIVSNPVVCVRTSMQTFLTWKLKFQSLRCAPPTDGCTCMQISVLKYDWKLQFTPTSCWKCRFWLWVMRNVFCYAFHQPIDCSTKQACKWTSKQAFNKDWIQPIIMNQKPMVIGERNLAWAFSSKLSKSGIRQSAMNIQLSRTTGGQSWRVKLHTRLYNHIVVHAGRNSN